MRSRNASVKNYHRTSRVDLDHVPSNFGMQRDPMVRNAVLDSVKCISDSVAIMYTSYYCSSQDYSPSIAFTYDDEGKSTRTYSNPRVGSKWEPGVLRVYNHPLFRHQHSLDSVKEVLDRDYYFNLPADSIKFIGFDNVKEQVKEDTAAPVKMKRKKNTSDGGLELILLLLIPFCFAAILLKLSLTKLSAIGQQFKDEPFCLFYLQYYLYRTVAQIHLSCRCRKMLCE